MDEIEKLYNVITSEGLYTKSLEDFNNQFSDNAYKEKVFDVVSKKGLYTKDFDSFTSKYSVYDTGIETPEDTGVVEKVDTKVETEPVVDNAELIKKKEYEFDNGIFKKTEREAYDKYKNTGEIDINLLPKEVEEVGFIEDKLSKLSRGVLSTAKGISEFKSSLLTYGFDKAIDVFYPEVLTNKEDRLKALKLVKEVSDVTQGTNFLEKGIIELGNNIREYDSESIADDIGKGNFLQAADRAIGGVFESAPSLALAFLGPGGLIALGTSSAGNKFEEEFENNPEEGLDRIMLNSILSGTAEASFELVTRGILSKARLLKSTGNTKAADDLINSYANNTIKRCFSSS